MDLNEHTIRTPNDILYHDDCAEIILRDMDKKIVGGAIIDLDDVERCKQYKWSRMSSTRKTNYVTSRINGRNIRLHQFITGYYDGELHIDHINHNTFDNRKCNLRIVTPKENILNRSPRKIPGVYFHENKWYFRVRTDNGYYNSHVFDTQKEAYEARKKFIGGDSFD